ncbi:MAG: acyltransferase [Desulfovibrio sp.]|jgi:peptidoglycan/LPS O-acetylase OafA/YrhL|nr:acyltransferase [Desulfovibrio sp.]
MQAISYRPDIDGLRALAVLCVVAYHAFPQTLRGGFIGVDIFFVISGYLITWIILKGLNDGSFSFREFYFRRIRRIFPALIVVMVSALLFGWFVLLPTEYAALGKQTFGGSFFSANLLLWRESGYFDITSRAKPLLHLWSLGIEEQFYLFFPLMLWVCTKRRFRPAVAILALGFLSFLDNLYLRHIDRVADFYSPLSRVWELMAGAALCTIMRQASVKCLYLKIDSICEKVCFEGGGGVQIMAGASVLFWHSLGSLSWVLHFCSQEKITLGQAGRLLFQS